MRTPTQSQIGRSSILLVAGFILGGCNALSRLADVGSEPSLTEI